MTEETAFRLAGEALEACDVALNWHDPRIIPSEEVRDVETAFKVAKKKLAEFFEGEES